MLKKIIGSTKELKKITRIASMKGLSRGNSIFRKKSIPEEQGEREKNERGEEKRSVTINLTLNLSLDRESLNKAMDMLELYSEYADESSSYRKSNSSGEYKYKDRY
jgi:hypothetical protein